MYDRMIREHGYSIRKLAEKLGKDKGYLENRLRLADAPPEVRELVSLRKDTLSHAYELLKIPDPRKRRRLAGQVARGELSLAKLREKVEGRLTRPRALADDDGAAGDGAAGDGAAGDGAAGELDSGRSAAGDARTVGEDGWLVSHETGPLTDESLVAAKQALADAIEELVGVLGAPTVIAAIGAVDRANLAKYLTIAKLRLENAIALVRSGEPRN
jgi:hypothetical protein